jgi:hypothetical protein
MPRSNARQARHLRFATARFQPSLSPPHTGAGNKLWERLRSALLFSRKDRNPHRHVPVIVVIVGDIGEDFFLHEKCRLAVRELLHNAGKRHAQPADAPDVIFVRHLPIKTQLQPAYNRADMNIYR